MTDPASSPDLGNALSQISGSGTGALQSLQEDQAKLEGVGQDIAGIPQFDPAKEQQGAPQINRTGVMSTMPWLIGLAALGGKVVGVHPKIMLGAVNGMTKGLIQGNDKAYQDAKAKYDESYQRYMDKYKQQLQIYKEMQQVYKGQVNADLKALEISLRATGYQGKVDADSLKEWQWAQEHTPQFEAARTEELQARAENERARAAKAKSDESGGLSPQASAILAEVTARGVPLPAGSRSAKVLSSVFNSLAERYADKSPGEIADKIKSGEIDMKAAGGAAALLGRREAGVASGLASLTEPGGLFDQLDTAASKINFGDSKTISQLRLAAQGKAVANEDIQAYRNIIKDVQADMSQILSRTGQTTNQSRDMAEEMFPLDSSLGEMRRSIAVGKKVASAILSGNTRIIEAVKSGKSLEEAAGLVDQAPPPPQMGDPGQGPATAHDGGAEYKKVNGKWIRQR